MNALARKQKKKTEITESKAIDIEICEIQQNDVNKKIILQFHKLMEWKQD